MARVHVHKASAGPGPRVAPSLPHLVAAVGHVAPAPTGTASLPVPAVYLQGVGRFVSQHVDADSSNRGSHAVSPAVQMRVPSVCPSPAPTRATSQKPQERHRQLRERHSSPWSRGAPLRSLHSRRDPQLHRATPTRHTNPDLGLPCRMPPCPSPRCFRASEPLRPTGAARAAGTSPLYHPPSPAVSS